MACLILEQQRLFVCKEGICHLHPFQSRLCVPCSACGGVPQSVLTEALFSSIQVAQNDLASNYIPPYSLPCASLGILSYIKRGDLGKISWRQQRKRGVAGETGRPWCTSQLSKRLPEVSITGRPVVTLIRLRALLQMTRVAAWHELMPPPSPQHHAILSPPASETLLISQAQPGSPTLPSAHRKAPRGSKSLRDSFNPPIMPNQQSK